MIPCGNKRGLTLNSFTMIYENILYRSKMLSFANQTFHDQILGNQKVKMGFKKLHH